MNPVTRFGHVLRWPLLTLWLGLVCLFLGLLLSQAPWFQGWLPDSPPALLQVRLSAPRLALGAPSAGAAAGLDLPCSGSPPSLFTGLGLCAAYGLAFLLLFCPGSRSWEAPALPRLPSPAFSLGFSLAAALLVANAPAVPSDLFPPGSFGTAAAAAFCLSAGLTRLLWRRTSDYVRLKRFAGLFLLASIVRLASTLSPTPPWETWPPAARFSEGFSPAALALLWSLGLFCRALFLARSHDRHRRFLTELGGTFGDLPSMPRTRTGRNWL